MYIEPHNIRNICFQQGPLTLQRNVLGLACRNLKARTNIRKSPKIHVGQFPWPHLELRYVLSWS